MGSVDQHSTPNNLVASLLCYQHLAGHYGRKNLIATTVAVVLSTSSLCACKVQQILMKIL